MWILSPDQITARVADSNLDAVGIDIGLEDAHITLLLSLKYVQ